MTCNPHWPEITERPRPGQTFADIPLVVVRVFSQKLAILLKRIKAIFAFAGGHQYTIQVVEFQKRGLPHVHILIKFRHDCSTPDDIDAAVSAEMPTDPTDAALVSEFDREFDRLRNSDEAVFLYSNRQVCARRRNA